MTSPSPQPGPRKVALITGGASGIGLAMARHFATSGAHDVAILDVRADTDAARADIAAAAPHARVVAQHCDVASWASQARSFRAVHAALGRIDVVCANAGVSERGASALRLDAAEGEDGGEPVQPDLTVLDVNLAGVIYSVKLAMHYMSKNQLTPARSDSYGGASRGSILCTSSNAGLYPFPVSPLYAASKAGVIGLVRSAARAAAPLGIQINALAPAMMVTNMAPSKDIFTGMVITPMTTLLAGVARLMADPQLSGEVAEIHGASVTLRPPHAFVDEDSRWNLELFWSLGYS